MLCTLVLWGCVTPETLSEAAQRDLLGTLHKLNDEAIPAKLARQQRAPETGERGGIPGQHGIVHAGTTAGFLRDLSVAYASPASRYHQDSDLLDALHGAASFLLDAQHPDGTIDLLTTNFHSPPDTAFTLEWVCLAAGVLKSTKDPRVAPLVEKLLKFIRLGADALAVGGIHTPNHRWVVCMALARANALILDPRYVSRIDTWLAEGVDIDPDGQFTERSTSIYSPLTDRCLLTVARLLDRPELLKPVRRNLEMSLHYMHADGEAVTEGSRRQDQDQKRSMVRYYYPYRYMAQHDDNGRFAAMAQFLEATQTAGVSSQLIYFLEAPELAAPLPPPTALPANFERHFSHSGLVRIRRGEMSATILADNPSFFSLHVGSAAVTLRFASAFFGKGQFVGQRLRRQGKSWVLSQDLTGPYYQPIGIEHRRSDGDWNKMPRELRPTSEVQSLKSTVRITEVDRGFDVKLDISGTNGVPIAIEFNCRDGSSIFGAARLTQVPGAWVLPSGEARISSDNSSVFIGEGQAAHRWTQIRGALPKRSGESVYVTGFSPFQDTLRFRW